MSNNKIYFNFNSNGRIKRSWFMVASCWQIGRCRHYFTRSTTSPICLLYYCISRWYILLSYTYYNSSVEFYTFALFLFGLIIWKGFVMKLNIKFISRLEMSFHFSKMIYDILIHIQFLHKKTFRIRYPYEYNSVSVVSFRLKCVFLWLPEK